MASLATVNTNDIGKVQGLSGNVTKLMNKVFPLTVSLSADKTVYAKGTTADVTITIKPMRDGNVVVPDSIKVNGAGTSVASTYTAKGVSATTKYTVTVTKDGVSASADLWVSFVNPTYYGVVSASATGTGDLSALTKDLSTGRKRTITLSPPTRRLSSPTPRHSARPPASRTPTASTTSPPTRGARRRWARPGTRRTTTSTCSPTRPPSAGSARP